MKRVLVLIVISFLLFPLSAEARVDLPDLNTSHYFVQDNAEVLSGSTIDELNEKGAHLEEGTGVELLLMTMPTTGQEHRQDYALKALREYGVGKEEKDNGIVILLNLDNGNEFNNRGVEVQVGYGIEGYLNDAKIGAIIDEVAFEHFIAASEEEEGSDAASEHYQTGLANLYNALYQESLDAYGYEDGEFTRDAPIEDRGSGAGSPLSLFEVIFRLIFSIIVIYILYKIITGGGGRPPKGPGGRGGRRRGPVIFFPPSGGGGTGGFGGGGGFGGFGGGSGGGGGAGRGF
ncbi:TPM domain-containing protein [Salinicoccus sp. HZC-1]|uniref:TPM domain-containing protein n=1 Tax=Salinicoccus sp. HZC-1 TaxID=3385497 RepID=UPI00398B96AE